MTDHQPAQPELFAVAELPGRLMLHWHGKRPLREIPYYHLMREFRGKIKLICIDPPPPHHRHPRPPRRAGAGRVHLGGGKTRRGRGGG